MFAIRVAEVCLHHIFPAVLVHFFSYLKLESYSRLEQVLEMGQQLWFIAAICKTCAAGTVLQTCRRLCTLILRTLAETTVFFAHTEPKKSHRALLPSMIPVKPMHSSLTPAVLRDLTLFVLTMAALLWRRG